MAENEEPLLQSLHHEGCPGCEMDQWKETKRGIPYRLFIHVWFITLCAALPISSLFPFLYFMPADKFPNLFSKESFFGRFPYFLPCLFISLFAAIVLSTCHWIPETLHKHHQSKPATMITEGFEGSFDGTEEKIDLEELEGCDGDHSENLFMNWPLMSSIIVYCVFSLHDMAYTEILPLWAESGRTYGGLEFSSQDVGEVLAISGFSLLAFQLFAYPPAEKVLGHVNLCRAAAMLTLPLNAVFPFISKLSGLELKIILNCASLVKNCLSVSIITGLFILQNNAVPQYQRGAANGIAMSGQSIFKAIAPAAGGAIFSWSQKRRNSSFLPGNHMVFFILNLVAFVGLLMTFKPFLTYSTQRRL